MKVVLIFKKKVHRIMDEYDSASEARQDFDPKTIIEEAPDEVQEGWDFNENAVGDARFSRPTEEGKIYVDYSKSFVDAETYRLDERKTLHEATTNDTMEAYRKLRQGDKTIDWQAWLDALDAYNVAIEETKNQEGYPLTVEYPEYPTKPTPQP